VVVQLHLARDPAPVEVRVPPAPHDGVGGRPVLIGRLHVRDAEVALLRVRLGADCRRLRRCARRFLLACETRAHSPTATQSTLMYLVKKDLTANKQQHSRNVTVSTD